LKIKLDELIKRLRRKPVGEREDGHEAPEKTAEMPVVRFAPKIIKDFRFPKRPELIFVGSRKGGAGKSLIATTLAYVVAANSDRKVYAVDLDLNSMTLSSRIARPKVLAELRRSILARADSEYMNVADILIQRQVTSTKKLIVRETVKCCDGSYTDVSILHVPALHVVRAEQQKVDIFTGATRQDLRYAIEELVLHFKNASWDKTVIFDARPQEELAPVYDAIYGVMKEKADAIILVTDPLKVSYSELMMPFRDVQDKVVIVLNKAVPDYTWHYSTFIRDAARDGIPVFFVPYDEKTHDLYTNRGLTPGLDLTSPVAKHVGALATFLQLTDRCDKCECCKIYNELIQVYRALIERLAYG